MDILSLPDSRQAQFWLGGADAGPVGAGVRLLCVDGFLRDAALLHQPWDVDLAAVACPTHLWYGEHDERALPGAAWFADRIAQASLVVRPHSTHLATLADHWPDILVTLTDRPSPC